MKDLEVKIHSHNQISIKDLRSDISIEVSKWDFIFNNELLSRNIYFHGFRLEQDLSEIDKITIKTYANEKAYLENDFFNIIIDVSSSLSLSRNGISQLWNLYEYPAIYSIKDESDFNTLKEICIRNESIENYLKEIPSFTAVYKSFESNVLWLSSNCIPWSDFLPNAE